MPKSAVQHLIDNAVISTWTTDLVGAVNNVAGYAAGVQSMAIDGLSTTAKYPAGAKFRITGHGQPYVLDAVATMSGGGATVTFYPPLEQAVANNDVLTFDPPAQVNASDRVAGLLTFQVVGATAGSATLIAQGTVDGATWVTVGVVPVNSTTMATSITADNIYRLDGTGLTGARVLPSVAGTGTTTVTWFPTEG